MEYSLEDSDYVYISYIRINNFRDIISSKGIEKSLLVLYYFQKLIYNFCRKHNIQTFSLSDHEFLTFYKDKKEANISILEHDAITKLLRFEKLALKKNILLNTIILTSKIEKGKIKFLKDGILEAFLSLRNEADTAISKPSFSKIIRLNPDELVNYIKQKRAKLELLETALKKNAVVPYFQPIVSLKTHQVDHLEVLMRIILDGKVYSAGYFIDELLDHNFIDLDIMLLQKLQEMYKEILDINISLNINVSPKQLASINYRKKLFETLDFFRKKNPKFQIHLEITEQSLMKNFSFLKLLKEEFKDLKLAVDDFGTGYSSLSLVSDLVKERIVSYLKIDGSLVKNLKEDDYLKSIIKVITILSKEFGIQTVAEYVEDEYTEVILKTLGIDFGQGYFYSPPLPLKELKTKLLNSSVIVKKLETKTKTG